MDAHLVRGDLVYERHGQVQLLGEDAGPPGAALVRGAHHRLLPVWHVLFYPPAH